MELIYNEYAKEESARVKDVMKKKSSPADLRFAFIPDLHYKYNEEMRVTIADIISSLNDISSEEKLDFVCFGGDNVGNYPESPAQHIEMMRELAGYADMLNMPWFAVQGNHDDNSIHGAIRDSTGRVLAVRAGTEVLDKSQYDIFVSHQKSYPGYTHGGGEKLYGFYDVPGKKHRVIFLNGDEAPHIVKEDGTLKYSQQWVYAYSGEQIEFLVNALKTAGDKSVTLIQHIPCKHGFANDAVPINEDGVNEIINAFVSKSALDICGDNEDLPFHVTADFSSSSAYLTALICGHDHNDRALRDHRGLLHIVSLCAGRDPRNMYLCRDGKMRAKIPGSQYETGFDIFCIKTDTQKINAFRYGIGCDREF